MAKRTAMTPEWSRYAAKLKNTEVIAGAIAGTLPCLAV
jgi:hypothetical protein